MTFLTIKTVPEKKLGGHYTDTVFSVCACSAYDESQIGTIPEGKRFFISVRNCTVINGIHATYGRKIIWSWHDTQESAEKELDRLQTEKPVKIKRRMKSLMESGPFIYS